MKIASVCEDDVRDCVKWRLGHGWLILNSWNFDEEEEEGIIIYNITVRYCNLVTIFTIPLGKNIYVAIF